MLMSAWKAGKLNETYLEAGAALEYLLCFVDREVAFHADGGGLGSLVSVHRGHGLTRISPRVDLARSVAADSCGTKSILNVPNARNVLHTVIEENDLLRARRLLQVLFALGVIDTFDSVVVVEVLSTHFGRADMVLEAGGVKRVLRFVPADVLHVQRP